MTTISHTTSTPVGVAGAAVELGVSPQTVRDLIRRGELPALRIGRAIRIRRADLSAYVQRALEAATTAR